jgi:hypothetical protein
VELEKERFRALRVGIGAKIFLKPRHVQVFSKVPVAAGTPAWEI